MRKRIVASLLVAMLALTGNVGLCFGGEEQPITRQEFCRLLVPVLEAWGMEVPEDADSPFSDCDDRAVTFCAAQGIVSGVGGGRFGPDEHIQRQAAVKMLQAAAALKEGATASEQATFSDMPHVFDDGQNIRAWARAGVTWAYRLGITAGVGQNRFDPTGVYTREQAEIMMEKLYKAVAEPEKIEKPAPDFYPFSDITYSSRISTWYGSDLKAHSAEELGRIYPIGASYGLGGWYGPVGTSNVAVVDGQNRRLLKEFHGSNGYFYNVTFFGDWAGLVQSESDSSGWGSAVVNLKTGQVLEGAGFYSRNTLPGSRLQFAIGRDGKWIGLTETGMLGQRYEKAGLCRGGVALVQKSGSWQLIDGSGTKLADIKIPKGAKVDEGLVVGKQMVLERDGKTAFFEGGYLNREGFVPGRVTLCLQNEDRYIRETSQGKSFLYDHGGTQLAGPFNGQIEELGLNLYRRVLDEQTRRYFCIDGTGKEKVLFDVKMEPNLESLKTDGAGVYALNISSDTVVFFDCFGDVLSTVKAAGAGERIVKIDELEGIFGIWVEGPQKEQRWFTPMGKKIPFPSIEPDLNFWTDDGSL